MFQSEFQQLMSLSIVSKFRWSVADLESLQAAVQDGRMPRLQTLVINHGSLRNRIEYILDVMEANTCQISTTDLEDTRLSTRDGELLLAALRRGKLRRVHSLYLSRNVDLQPLMNQIAQAAAYLGLLIYYQHQYDYHGLHDHHDLHDQNCNCWVCSYLWLIYPAALLGHTIGRILRWW